jgi:hypothetical protein
VNAKGGRLAEAIERLQADNLMPPVKSVETAAGGLIRVVVGRFEADLRARLATAMGTTRWTLVEANDDGAAGVDFRSPTQS